MKEKEKEREKICKTTGTNGPVVKTFVLACNPPAICLPHNTNLATFFKLNIN